ncbi:hypothetical protein PSTT_14683 [Puccinia striiformis]|uniref:BED-type domain-containing protein n=1 Tax=Puccinia striiformis TaxID=27350 RepID=A0A2S4UL59_9BASI|nr:hypothetical protein PSTT_14683 [Puccinia striiformis]
MTGTRLSDGLTRPHAQGSAPPGLCCPIDLVTPPSNTTRSSKKRRKVPSSPLSSVNSTPARSQETRGTQSSTTRVLTDEQELRRIVKLHANQLSACHTSFDVPRLSDPLDKHHRKMIAFPCKSCGKHINWQAYENSTTNLAKHVAGCLKKQQDDLTSQKLVALEVSGTGDIDPREVPQLCAIWCAEGARPFSALGEDAHRGILHPVVLKTLPTRKAVLRDIGMLYTAVQKSFIDTLKKHQGAMYLGLDTWQSPNGLDVLGTVIYRLVQGGDDGFRLEAVPLDNVRLKERHTDLRYRDRQRNKQPGDG